MSAYRQIDPTFIGCHIYTAPARRVLSERREDLCEIIAVLNGVYQARHGDQKHETTLIAGSGEAVLWPANAWRLEFNDPQRPLHCIAIYFRNPPWGELPIRVRDHGGLIRILAHRMIEIKGMDLGEDRMQELYAAFTHAILAEYIRIACLEKDTLTAKVARYIEDNMARAFTLAELSRAIGLEQHHFGRRFKQITGRTPMDEARRCKAAHARDIFLTAPNRPLKAVCARVGIANPKRLSRLIHRYYGIRLRELRKTIV